MSVVAVSSNVLDAGSTPAISTNFIVTTRLLRVMLWVDGLSFFQVIEKKCI